MVACKLNLYEPSVILNFRDSNTHFDKLIRNTTKAVDDDNMIFRGL